MLRSGGETTDYPIGLKYTPPIIPLTNGAIRVNKIDSTISSMIKTLRVNVVSSRDVVKESHRNKKYYQNFEEMAEMSNDPYWKALFTNAANGTFISGFSFNGTWLTFTDRLKKTNKTSDVMLTGDTEQDYVLCINFFRDKGNISSPWDIERERSIRKEYVGTETINLKKASVRRELIRAFIIKTTDKYQLTEKESQQLEIVINENFIIKRLNNNSIILNSNAIEWIDGLVFDPTRRYFSIITETKSKVVRNKNCKYNYLYDKIKTSSDRIKGDAEKSWNKWLKSTNKIYLKTIKYVNRFNQENKLNSGKKIILNIQKHNSEAILSLPTNDSGSIVPKKATNNKPFNDSEFKFTSFSLTNKQPMTFTIPSILPNQLTPAPIALIGTIGTAPFTTFDMGVSIVVT